MYTTNQINDYITGLNLTTNTHYLNFIKKCQAVLSRSVLRELFEGLISNELSIEDFFELDDQNNITTIPITPTSGFNDVGIMELIDEIKSGSTSYHAKYIALKSLYDQLVLSRIDSFPLQFEPRMSYLFNKQFNTVGETSDSELSSDNNIVNYNLQYFKVLNTRVEGLQITVPEDINMIDPNKFWTYSELSGIFGKFLLNYDLLRKEQSDDFTYFMSDKVYYEITEINPATDEYTPGTLYFRRYQDPINSSVYYEPVSFFGSNESTIYTFSRTSDIVRNVSAIYFSDVYQNNNAIFDEISLSNTDSRKEKVRLIKKHLEVSFILNSTIFSMTDENNNHIMHIGDALHNVNNFPFFLKMENIKFNDTVIDYPEIKKFYFGLYNYNKAQIYDSVVKLLIDRIIRSKDIEVNAESCSYIDSDTGLSTELSIGIFASFIKDELDTLYSKLLQVDESALDDSNYCHFVNMSKVFVTKEEVVNADTGEVGDVSAWRWIKYDISSSIQFDTRCSDFLKIFSARNSVLVTSNKKLNETGGLNSDYYGNVYLELDGSTPIQDEPVSLMNDSKTDFTDAINNSIEAVKLFPFDFFEFLSFFICTKYYMPLLTSEFTEEGKNAFINDFNTSFNASYTIILDEMQNISRLIKEKIDLQRSLITTDYRFITEMRRTDTNS